MLCNSVLWLSSLQKVCEKGLSVRNSIQLTRNEFMKKSDSKDFLHFTSHDSLVQGWYEGLRFLLIYVSQTHLLDLMFNLYHILAFFIEVINSPLKSISLPVSSLNDGYICIPSLLCLCFVTIEACMWIKVCYCMWCYVSLLALFVLLFVILCCTKSKRKGCSENFHASTCKLSFSFN